MSKRRRTAQAMSDEAKIAVARKKIVALGLDEKEIMPKLLEKYGVLAYDFVNKAVLEPGRLCNRTGEKFLATRKLISHYAEDDIEPAMLAKAVNKKPEEVKAKAAAYRAEHAHDEETKPAEVREIERTAEIKYVQVENEIDHRSNIPLLSIDQLMNLHSYRGSEFAGSVTQSTEQKPEREGVSILRPEYDPNTPEGRARKKAQERLAELKGGKNGELSFGELMENGVNKADMNVVMTPDNFENITPGPLAKELATNAQKVEKGKSDKNGRCLEAVREATQDTIGVKKGDYRRYTNSRKATDSRELWEKTDDFLMFEYKNEKNQGNPEVDSLPVGAVLTYENGTNNRRMHGRNFSYYGHIAVKGDAGWYSNLKQRSLASGDRYGERYWVSLSKDSTVSDQMAEDMLYQQYLREENLMYKKLAMNRNAER